MQTPQQGAHFNIVPLPEDNVCVHDEARSASNQILGGAIVLSASTLNHIHDATLGKFYRRETMLTQDIRYNIKDASLLTKRNELSTQLQDAQWRHILETRFNFSGQELDHAATLLGNFAQGVTDACAYNRSVRDMDRLKTPELYFFESASELSATTLLERGAVMINIRWLKRYAQHDTKDIFKLSTGGDVILFGTIEDIFYATGVEEGDHHAFGSDPRLTTGQSSANADVPLDEYDAREVEYRWLETAINLPRIQSSARMYTTLRDRRAAATAHRETAA